MGAISTVPLVDLVWPTCGMSAGLDMRMGECMIACLREFVQDAVR